MMGTPPFETWACRTISRDALFGRVDVWYPPGDEAAASLATSYWRGDLDSEMTIARQHKWGGKVLRYHPTSSDEPIYLKRLSIRGPRYLHKPRRARHTILQQEQMAAAGFHVPESLFLVERIRAGVVTDSAVAMKGLGAMPSVFALINRPDDAHHLTTSEKRSMLMALGREVGKMHRAGLFHGDMHLNNVLYRTDEEEITFSWIDNEEGRRFSRLPFRCRVHDLNHINRYRHAMTLTDRMRIWRGYLAEAGLSKREATTLARRVIAHTQAYQKKRGWEA